MGSGGTREAEPGKRQSVYVVLHEGFRAYTAVYTLCGGARYLPGCKGDLGLRSLAGELLYGAVKPVIRRKEVAGWYMC